MKALFVFSVFVPVAFAQTSTLTHLPNTAVNALRTDAAGNIYIAGHLGVNQADWDAFVAKLSPAGQVIYSTSFAGNRSDSAAAIAVNASGSAYVFGQTASADFPVTAGAMQTTMQAPNVQGFAAKLDPAGKVVYATYIGGSADIYPNGPPVGLSVYYAAGGLAVDSAGDAILSGYSQTFMAGVPSQSYQKTSSFVLKLDSLGAKTLTSVQGIGGLLALDGGNNLFVAGTYAWNDFSSSNAAIPAPVPIPITPGAFQSGFQSNRCLAVEALSYRCPYQYVVKLNAALDQTIYATYLSGSFGAVPEAISVDAQGDVFLAGTTNSPDYPTTPNAFEPGYIVGPPPVEQSSVGIFPPPSSGFVTELNASGNGLIYSSYFSGRQADTIRFAAFTPTVIYISGSAGANDLPGLENYPSQCAVPTYAALLSADATAVGLSRAVSGNVLGYDPMTGMLVEWNGSDLLALNPQKPPPPIACILDAADLRPVNSIAPGELISIFGDRFTGSRSGSGYPAVPAGNGTGVTVNGLPASLLYVSPQQINAQVPFELAGAAQANIVFTSSTFDLEDSRTLPVVATQPAIFVDSSTAIASLCFPGAAPIPVLPLSFNSDGTRNSCLQPVAAGTAITVFLEGLGTSTPLSLSVMVAPNSGVGGGRTSVNLSNLPGSTSGVWQAEIQIPAGVTGMAYLESLTVDGAPVALFGSLPAIWVR